MNKTLARHTSTGRDHLISHGQQSDATRRHKFGPIQPMPEPSFWQRMFGRNNHV